MLAGQGSGRTPGQRLFYPKWVPAGASAFWDFTGNRAWVSMEPVALEDAISFTRSSTALWNPTGEYQEYATNVLRRADGVGALLEVGRGNKCTNFNANPTDLTGVNKGGDAAATLTVVDDSAALEAAGLGEICTSGMVYRLDNSAGTGAAWVTIDGSTSNTNPHSLSVLVRVMAGSWKLELSGGGAGEFTSSPTYTRLVASGLVPSDASRRLALTSPSAGGVVYFILNQLEEGPSATTPIITSGATATRAGDELTLPLPSGAHDLTMTFDDGSTAPLASGASGSLLIDPALATRTIKHITARPA